MLTLLYLPTSLAVFAGTPGTDLRPDITQGKGWKIVDSTSQQVGTIIEPRGCGIVLAKVCANPNWDTCPYVKWMGGQLDTDADGFINGADLDLYLDWFAAGSFAADYDCDGFVNGDDFDAFTADFQKGPQP